jgi:hypothetical protein
MIKQLMGVVGVILAAWGFGFLYTAFFASYGVWWDQGTVGVACWDRRIRHLPALGS